jgi:formylglycine-generating enzyme required for sulfatase activity
LSKPTAVGTAGSGGTIAKDAAGNLIAQGNCPADMVAIRKSASYPGGAINSFCIDRYEAPNQKGVKPFTGVTEFEAEWYCNESGKRLCTNEEWTRACSGPDGANKYCYGPQYIEGKIKSTATSYENWGGLAQTGNPPAPCNYDTPGKSPIWTRMYSLFTTDPAESSLKESNPKRSDERYKKQYDIMKQEVARMDGTEPSGSREACVTAEGVYDMSGNAQEIVMKSGVADLTLEQRIAAGVENRRTLKNKPYTWMGFFWTPTWHKAGWSAKPTCTAASGGPHAVGWRSYENGFRCCMNLRD